MRINILQTRMSLLLRRLSDATPACLMVMVQGDITVITLEHWLTALQTGTIAGLGAIVISFFPRDDLRENKYVNAGITGVMTAIADYITHPTHFGAPTTEAVITGVAAGLLCVIFSGIGTKKPTT